VFRTALPVQYIGIEGGTVNRYERTRHRDAPRGRFVLGNTFAGAALTNPDGVAQDVDGNVYIREAGGRILQFDRLGNFIAVVASSPVPFNSTQSDVSQYGSTERAWKTPGAGDWADLDNWYYWGRPDTNYEIAHFGDRKSTRLNS